MVKTPEPTPRRARSPAMRQPNRVTVYIADQAWNGHWELDGRDLRLFSAYGSARTPLGRRKPETVAKAEMTSIVQAWRQGRPRP
ncbi:hypothetical protein [Phenylobacterium sp. SCN 70-31]|uniref:hypothetical protein n=1 Tax=Phenylobacterium sp. SCN 70-31 TaxID=1660129 RepID=UPI0025CFC93A|nr:hypothetical protein [Phenylobacterium sp. SCN 70-31]